MRRTSLQGTLPGIAALAAGGLLLAQMARTRHQPVSYVFDDALMGHDTYVRIPLGTTLAAAALIAAGGLLLSSNVRRGGAGRGRTVEESIELDVPVSTAYNQWTQFEEFPRFMASVESVQQVDDTHLHWRALVGGKMKEWDAEITEQIPDKRIAWRSTGGVQNGGVVTFHKISESRTRVMLQMDYNPETVVEKVGDAVGAVKLTAKGNLKKFKHLVEARGTETGAWRGTVQQH
jgi:uncharacterized membrane protein